MFKVLYQAASHFIERATNIAQIAIKNIWIHSFYEIIILCVSVVNKNKKI